MSDSDERVDPQDPPAGIHEPGTSPGNELAEDRGREPGRASEGKAGADRKVGGRDRRDATGINPEMEKAQGDTKEIPPA
jgi:hypothetical protein